MGYGDVSINTDGGKVWACVQICLSVGLLGEVISSIGMLQEQRAAMLKHNEIVSSFIDAPLLESERHFHSIYLHLYTG